MANKKANIQKREAESVEKVERTRAGKIFIPPVDIIEKDDEIVLISDMPGVDEKAIKITLEKDVLTIQGQVEPQKLEGFNLAYSEYEVGDYHRSFTLNDTIDQDKIEASYKNGVLRVKLPKAEPAKPKKIEVKAE